MKLNTHLPLTMVFFVNTVMGKTGGTDTNLRTAQIKGILKKYSKSLFKNEEQQHFTTS